MNAAHHATWPTSPASMTDPDANQAAKKDYKGLLLQGTIADDYVYATLLSKHLIPFGYERLHMVALPIYQENNILHLVTTETDFLNRGDADTWDSWFQTASETWDRLKKSKTTFFQQLNHHNKITLQKPQSAYKVLYAASGKNLASCVLDTSKLSLVIYGRTTQGFIADHKTYWYDTASQEEAHYLCALLNSDVINKAIKGYQSQGTFGQRDIHRTPFEACTIPMFDSTNSDHLALAQESIKAHEDLAFIQQSKPLKGGVVALRNLARKQATAQLKAIEILTARVVG